MDIGEKNKTLFQSRIRKKIHLQLTVKIVYSTILLIAMTFFYETKIKNNTSMFANLTLILNGRKEGAT